MDTSGVAPTGGDGDARPPQARPLVSVIIPCYGHGRFLRDAVASVVAQTYRDTEIIIVNDGCPGDTSAVARGLISEFPRHDIRLLEKPNGGLADARNAGIAQARGRWILPLDADDVLAPVFLEAAVALIDPGARFQIITPNLQEFGARRGAWDLPPYTQERLLQGNIFLYCSLYPKALWDAVGGYEVALPWGNEDWNFWVGCSEHAPVVTRIAERLFYYRIHPGGGMLERMRPFMAEVHAMVHALHPALFGDLQLIADHRSIGQMHDETLAIIERRLADFPDRAALSFFRGLAREFRGDAGGALADYSRTLALSGGRHWQASLRMANLEDLSGHQAASGEHLRAVFEQRPGFGGRS